MILPFDHHRFRECLDFLFNEVNLAKYDDIQVGISSYKKDYYSLMINNKTLTPFWHETNWGKEIIPKKVLIGGKTLVQHSFYIN